MKNFLMKFWSQNPKWLQVVVVALIIATFVVIILLVVRNTISTVDEYAAATVELDTARTKANEQRHDRELKLRAAREQLRQAEVEAAETERECIETHTKFFSDVAKLQEAKISAFAELDKKITDLNKNGRKRTASERYENRRNPLDQTIAFERDCHYLNDSREARASFDMIMSILPTWNRLFVFANHLNRQLSDNDCIASYTERVAFNILLSEIEKSAQGIALFAAFSGYRVQKFQNIREMRIRYGDLKYQICNHIGIVAAAQPAEYYNCKYRSQSRWRSFQLGDSDGGEIYAYCLRGEQFCDRLLETSINTHVVGVAILRYPESNQICEEQQIELIAWNSDLNAIASAQTITSKDWQDCSVCTGVLTFRQYFPGRYLRELN